MEMANILRGFKLLRIKPFSTNLMSN